MVVLPRVVGACFCAKIRQNFHLFCGRKMSSPIVSTQNNNRPPIRRLKINNQRGDFLRSRHHDRRGFRIQRVTHHGTPPATVASWVLRDNQLCEPRPATGFAATPLGESFGQVIGEPSPGRE